MRIILDLVSMAITLLTLDFNIHHCMHGLVVPWRLLVKIYFCTIGMLTQASPIGTVESQDPSPIE